MSVKRKVQEQVPPNPCNTKKGKYRSKIEAEDSERKSQTPEVLEFVEKDKFISYFYKVKLQNEEYKVGNFIYLNSNIFTAASRTNFIGEKSLIRPKKSKKQGHQEIKDESIYTEFYRKKKNKKLSGSIKKIDPYEIGEIVQIYTRDWEKEKILLIVRRMYRTEKIPLENYYKKTDLNMLLWSDEEFRIPCESICGKCFVTYIKNIPKEDSLVWSADGPDRFYFKDKYDFLNGSIIPGEKLSSEAKFTGREVHVNYVNKYVPEDKLQYMPSYKKIRPLNCLDVFAGCGGLSRGLEDSGLVRCKWAIENNKNAAKAYSINNPYSKVITENSIQLLSGNKKNKMLPNIGEVEIICGGPPCQTFSGLNRYSSVNSQDSNPLIDSFFKYIEFYKPRYFIMENVKNFVTINKSKIFKSTVSRIKRMGYQFEFGILQAAHFGVPQDRKRLIIIAAAPGERLPKFPKPSHVYNGLGLNVGAGGLKSVANYGGSAPMRTITIHDALSDLPEIASGASLNNIPYNSEPITHFQRLLRCSDKQFFNSTLTDHICRKVAPLVQKRISLIPSNGDWRDLPNIIVELSNRERTIKLKYTHDSKNGKGKFGALRGVCKCAMNNQKCDNNEYKKRKLLTLIPWHLVHNADKHNNFINCYSRLNMEGIFITVTTDPNPNGKQGRVIHPKQHRIVSVREYARAQGFNDSFQFFGSIKDKYRQIGNAVPPPMAKAIGREIIKVIDQNPEF